MEKSLNLLLLNGLNEKILDWKKSFNTKIEVFFYGIPSLKKKNKEKTSYYWMDWMEKNLIEKNFLIQKLRGFFM